MLVDADAHFQIGSARLREQLPEPWARRVATGNVGPGHVGYWNPNGVRRGDAVTPDGEPIDASASSVAKHFLDVHGIDVAVLNYDALFICLSPETAFARAVIKALNDIIAADWLSADERFRASIVVPPGDPGWAAEEIHRCAANPGFVQVLMPSAAAMPYGHHSYHPIYQAAQEAGLPVAIHPGTEGTGFTGAPTGVGYPSTYFEWHTGLVSGYISHLVSLVTEGVFQRFPSLTYVLVEGGISWLPALLWRFDKNWRGLRQSTPWLDAEPSTIIQERVRLTTQPLEEPRKAAHLRAILDMFAADRMLMFSTDFPHWDGDTPDFAGRAFPPAIRERVMGGNAAALYRCA